MIHHEGWGSSEPWCHRMLQDAYSKETDWLLRQMEIYEEGPERTHGGFWGEHSPVSVGWLWGWGSRCGETPPTQPRGQRSIAELLGLCWDWAGDLRGTRFSRNQIFQVPDFLAARFSGYHVFCVPDFPDTTFPGCQIFRALHLEQLAHPVFPSMMGG